MDGPSRLFRVIQNNETATRRAECSKLLKHFENRHDDQHNSSAKESNTEKISSKVSDDQKLHSMVGNEIPVTNFNAHPDIVNDPSRRTVNVSTNRTSSLGIKAHRPSNDAQFDQVSKGNIYTQENEVDDDMVQRFSSDFSVPNIDPQRILEDSQLPSILADNAKKKKCLEKEVRPPGPNLTPMRRDSISTASTRSSLDPINEETNTGEMDSFEKENDSSIEIEELDAIPRQNRERSSSLRSSNRLSLEPILEDLETMEVDLGSSVEERVENVEVTNQEIKRCSSRNSKSPLETITEEHYDNESGDFSVEKLPLAFPASKRDFTWFDLQSPMIKPSRKRRLDGDKEDVFMSSSEDLNSSYEDIIFPYNVHDYRRSVNALISHEDSSEELESSPRTITASSTSSHGGFDVKRVLADLRARVVRHENSIHKISESLHASRGVNANLNEHLIHCHRNLLNERQSRQLIMEEIDRLEREGIALRKSFSISHGNLVINNISLQLKPSEAQVATEEPCDEEFHFICLLKCPSGRLAPSDIVSVSRQSRREKLEFRAKFSLSQVPSDFVVQLEIYAMTLIRRNVTGTISHEPNVDDYDNVSISSSTSSASAQYVPSVGSGVKKLRFIKRLLTPSKSSKRSVTESIDNSVSEDEDEGWRTTGFSILSSIRLTRQAANQTEFDLGKIPHLYPLTGKMTMNISLNYGQDITEERGFLSVFSHVGGFGAWQRLWCVLKLNRIVMWRYPNEEASDVEHVRIIELNQCISERVTLATKDVCFRPQTLVLEMASKPNENTEATKLLLSADTKAERVVWCNKINRCLNNLRSWNPSRFEEIRQRFRDK